MISSGHILARTLRALAVVVAALWLVQGVPFTAAAAEPAKLEAFARKLGLQDIEGFLAAVEAIAGTTRLPDRYIAKAEAERRGWRPGANLCRVAPGHVIGGDRFGNREGRLPNKSGRRWTEADLDYACGKRGSKRLVFSNDGLIYVTVDHYQSFHPVPR